MKVVDVSFSYDEHLVTEDDLLRQHYTTVGWAEALQRKGVDITVVKRFNRESTFCKNEVRYYFIKDSFGADLKFWQIPFSFLKRIVELNADVVHLHTFPSSFPAFILRFLLKKKCQRQ